MTPTIEGVHHIKIPVRDLARSRAWYETIFGLEHMLEFPDGEDVVRGVAYRPVAGVSIALREDAQRAAGFEGYDPFALLIEDRAAADEWIAHLDEHHVKHSGLIEATTGWLVGFTDPDGMQLVLYTREEHGLR